MPQIKRWKNLVRLHTVGTNIKRIPVWKRFTCTCTQTWAPRVWLCLFYSIRSGLKILKLEQWHEDRIFIYPLVLNPTLACVCPSVEARGGCVVLIGACYLPCEPPVRSVGGCAVVSGLCFHSALSVRPGPWPPPQSHSWPTDWTSVRVRPQTLTWSSRQSGVRVGRNVCSEFKHAERQGTISSFYQRILTNDSADTYQWAVALAYSFFLKVLVLCVKKKKKQICIYAGTVYILKCKFPPCWHLHRNIYL